MKANYFLIVLAFLISCTHTPREPAGKNNDFKFDKKVWEVISSDDLKKNYKTMWVISDVHGQFDKLIQILKKAGLIVSNGKWYVWNSAAKNQLLVVVGDMINKGPDSVGVVRLLTDLQTQSQKSQSKVVLMWGNHEVEYLAEPNKITQELNDSADQPEHRSWLGNEDYGDGLNATELATTKFYKKISELKLGAIIGNWMFVHAGYIDSKKSDTESYFEVLQEEYLGQNYEFLADKDNEGSSVITRHNWFRDEKKLEKNYENLSKLGLDGVVFGHDPDAFDTHYQEKEKTSIGAFAAGPDEWAVKTDVGMNPDPGYNKDARILKCPVNQIFNKDGVMVLVQKSVKRCVQLTPKGEVPVLTL